MYRIYLHPSGLVYGATAEEDLLSAAAAAGIRVPAACRNGVCELCAARLLDGQAVNTRNQLSVPVGGRLTLCRSQALTDLELEIPAVMASGTCPPRQYQARVVDVRPLSHHVYLVQLQLPRRRELAFHAGQYLAVNLPDTGPCYFSIASSPSADTIELHVQASPGRETAQRVMDSLTPGAEVCVELPYGRACLAAAPEQPLLLVAAGTGFAQMKSLIDYLRETGYGQPVTLFWGVRQAEDMYLRELAESWQAQWPPFTFVPVISDGDDNDWSGHHEPLVRAVLASAANWQQVQVFASGSPAMVYTLMDALTAQGLPAAAFHSDVLEYAPR